MDVIELACPVCREILEIDGGFAGGVCRCYSCGTLMTVPVDPGQEKAEQIRRPDRPEGPAAAGANAGRTPRSQEPSVTVGSGAEALSTGDEATVDISSEQVFTTASGRQIRIRVSQVPVAQRKHKAVRFTIIAVVAGVMLGMIVLAIVAVGLLVKEPTGANRGGAATAGLATHVMTNPFTLREARLLGMPLESGSVMIIDATGDSSGWLGLVKAAVVHTADRLPEDDLLKLVFYNEDKVHSYSRKVSALEESSLNEFLDQVQPAGVASPAAAITQATTMQPTTLVLVLGRSPMQPALDEIGATLDEKAPDAKLHVVVLGRDPSPELEAFVAARNGLTASLSERRLRRWFRDAQMASYTKEAADAMASQDVEPAPADAPPVE